MSDSESALPLCRCYSEVAYRVTAEDVPESDPETFEEFDVYESCGMQVSSPKREFRPGHDAKLKSVLQKAFRDGTEFAFLEGGVLVHANPMELAKARGWSHFMTAKPKRKSRKAKTGEDARVPGPATGAVNQAPEPTEVQGFRPARVKVGRWWKDGVIVLQDDTGVTVEYQTRKGSERIALPFDSDKLEIG